MNCLCIVEYIYKITYTYILNVFNNVFSSCLNLKHFLLCGGNVRVMPISTVLTLTVYSNILVLLDTPIK